MEICNGCTELNNLETLDKRYKIESEFRMNQNKKPHHYPNTLKWAFQNNFPDCAGVAVGLDRLFSAIHNEKI
jgi:lysyl-tRNA synthetase class 2